MNAGRDLTKLSAEEVEQHVKTPEVRSAWEALCADFECIGWSVNSADGTSEPRIERTIRRLLSTIPDTIPVFIVLALEEQKDINGRSTKLYHFETINAKIVSATKNFNNVILVNPKDAIDHPDDVIDATHFNRLVYFRLYRMIASKLDAWNEPNDRGARKT